MKKPQSTSSPTQKQLAGNHLADAHSLLQIMALACGDAENNPSDADMTSLRHVSRIAADKVWAAIEILDDIEDEKKVTQKHTV